MATGTALWSKRVFPHANIVLLDIGSPEQSREKVGHCMAFGPEWIVVGVLVLMVVLVFAVVRAFRRPRG